jgi:hypothetical protein
LQLALGVARRPLGIGQAADERVPAQGQVDVLGEALDGGVDFGEAGAALEQQVPAEVREGEQLPQSPGPRSPFPSLRAAARAFPGDDKGVPAAVLGFNGKFMPASLVASSLMPALQRLLSPGPQLSPECLTLPVLHEAGVVREELGDDHSCLQRLPRIAMAILPHLVHIVAASLLIPALHSRKPSRLRPANSRTALAATSADARCR